VQDALGDRVVERRHSGHREFLDALRSLADGTSKLGDLRLDGRFDRPVSLGANGALPRVLLGGS
jgi:hypothetical protein